MRISEFLNKKYSEKAEGFLDIIEKIHTENPTGARAQIRALLDEEIEQLKHEDPEAYQIAMAQNIVKKSKS